MPLFLKLHSFMNSFNIYLLSIFHMLNTALDTEDSAMNNIKKIILKKSLPVLGGEREVNTMKCNIYAG